MEDKTKILLRAAGIGVSLAAMVLAAVFAINNSRLKKELQRAQEALTAATSVELNNQAGDAGEEDRKALETLIKAFVNACYCAPPSDYGQAPYLTDYLTDRGVRDYLKAVNPAVWGDADISIANEVRAAYDSSAKMRDRSVQISGIKIYTEITESGASVLYYCDIKPDGAEYSTASFILEAECIKIGDKWRIDSLDTMQQIV